MTQDSTFLTTEDEATDLLYRLVDELTGEVQNYVGQVRRLKQALHGFEKRAKRWQGPLIRSKLRRMYEKQAPELLDTEEARQNSRLLQENQRLIEENASLSSIVKEYESVFQTIIKKFGEQAHKVQQNKREMQLEYEDILQVERAKREEMLAENAVLLTHLANINSLAKEAYEAQTRSETSSLIKSLSAENENMRKDLGINGGADGAWAKEEERDAAKTIAMARLAETAKKPLPWDDNDDSLDNEL